jgi:cellulose synthase/poly-beta-1,6-N-acetylglucosamine synthase-like glycosyltransferase
VKSSTGDLPKVAIVIPHRGDEVDLGRCLAGVAAQSYPGSSLDIVVVVNEEKERPLAVPIEPNVTLLWQTEFYSYAARNRGIEHTTADMIAFTDSDAVPHPDWIWEGVDAIKGGADIVAGHVKLSFTNSPLSPAACYEKLYAFDQHKNAVAGYAATANLFVTREALTRWGLFNNSSRSGEDFEWTRRATRAGANLVYSPTAMVSHPARETLTELLTKARRKTTLFARGTQSTSSPQGLLTARILHQLFTPPSHSKKASTTAPERVLALAVRLLLIGYKAICLAGLSPKFRREQRL